MPTTASRLIVASASALAVSLAGLCIVGCSKSSSSAYGFEKATLPPPPLVVGIALDYTDERVEGVSLSVAGAPSGGASRIDGLAALGFLPTGNQVLRVGDSVRTPTLLIPYTQANSATFLDRPIFLPSFESGISSSLASPVAAPTSLTSDNLAGVSLDLQAGTTIGNYSATLTVIGVSPSRLPVVPPTGLGEPRAAYLVEPHKATFGGPTPTTMTVPQLDTVSVGFDAYKVSTTTGQWVLVTGIVTGAGVHTFPVDEGTLYAVFPTTASPTVTVSGRVVAGTTPVAGYVASCWNRSSAPTGPDGTFAIPGVPDAYGAYLVRVQPEQPGVTFKPEVVTVSSTTPNLTADIVVAARQPDGIQPAVLRTSPAEGATNVTRSTQVTVTFSEPIDTQNKRPFKLVGPGGEVLGEIGYSNSFTARFRPTQNLEPATTYNILIDDRVRDLTGNLLNDDTINVRFTTAGGAPDPPPTDTLAFGIGPLTVSRGDTASVSGRNFTGGTAVKFGGTAGTVTLETSFQVQVSVPDFEPAGDVTVSLSAGGTGIGSLLPLVADLRATLATIFDGGTMTSLPFVDRATPPLEVLIDGGNTGNASVTVDGVPIAATNFQETVGGVLVTSGRLISFPAATPAPATLFTGPVVLRGANGRPSSTYRFLHVRD